ncbi:MAG: NUDIX hydrolase [Fastidiosipilaceae bacterium]|jgi:8-oxo-dGTP diphosphatase|nr:NUDIX domain-containing protein [Clostridiaceae bacterium]
MKEYFDLLDEHGNPVPERVPRGTKLPPNRNILAVHIFLQDVQGDYLIQKRSQNKALWPGLWDVTAGGVQAGETSREAAVREVREELGLYVPPEAMQKIARLRRHPAFWDIWYARIPIDVDQCKLQTSEVDEIKLVPKADLLSLFDQEKLRDEEYLGLVDKYLPEK